MFYEDESASPILTIFPGEGEYARSLGIEKVSVTVLDRTIFFTSIKKESFIYRVLH